MPAPPDDSPAGYRPGSPPKLLRTERLLMRASVPALAEATIDYLSRNLAHFARWDPTRPA